MRWVLGFVGLMVIGFMVTPAAKVAKVTGEPSFVYVADKDANGEDFRHKSGLRIAVEGRLKWLGLL